MSPWVRIDEKANEHPKIAGLTDGAFRLWVQGLAHCQKFLTDGHIDRVSLKALRAYSPKREHELLTVRLWDAAEDGVRFHDYLEWNESRRHVLKVRAQGRERIRRLRGKSNGVTPTVTNTVTTPVVTACVTRLYSGDGECSSSSDLSSSEGGVGETATPQQRAGAFCAWYEDTHQQIFGVGYMGTNGDYTKALELVAKFTDAELHDAAMVWFGMDDEFAKRGTRTIPKFASRVTGCLQRVKALGIA